MTERNEWLNRISEASTDEERANIYSDWSIDYERQVMEEGYIMPVLMSALVTRHVQSRSAPILDVGAGTGILGACLAILGYRHIFALDYSPVMLGICRKRGVYRDFFQRTLGKPLLLPDGLFHAVVVMGVFGTGHAPPHSLNDLVRLIASGGHIIFSLRPDDYDTGLFRESLIGLEENGHWKHIETTEPFNSVPLASSPIMNRISVYRIASPS